MAVCVLCGKEYRAQPHVCPRRVGPHGEVLGTFIAAPGEAVVELLAQAIVKDVKEQEGRGSLTPPPKAGAALSHVGHGGGAGSFSKPRAATKKTVAKAKKPAPKKAPVAVKRRAPAKGKK